MDEDNIQNSLSSKPFLPLAVGLVGVVIGAAGLIIAINAAGRASAIEKTYKGGIEKTTAISIEMEKINRKIDAIEENLKEARDVPAQVEKLRLEAQTAFAGLQNYIKEDRAAIAKLGNSLAEVSARQPAQQAAATQATQSADSSASAGAKKHVIKSGESFSSIAKKYGKRVSDIQNANPNVDPRRMLPGQEIVIP